MSIEVAFFGTLGRDAERKTSQSGKPYLRLNIRIGDDEAAQWVSVLAFDERALEVADKFIKGARVYVEGRLSTNEWIKDGEKRFGLSVLSWHCRLAQIGRQKIKTEKSEAQVSVAAGTYHSPRSAPAGRLPGSGDFDDSTPFAPETR